MSSLVNQKCVPCEGGVDPLSRDEFDQYLEQVKAWQVIDDVQLLREFRFENFKQALDFVNKVGKIAEKEGHHPDIYLYAWKKVRLTLTTHAIGGLSINDFVLASKIDVLLV
jgi:4a-hydroxytetrahydrobiopterin dehydratase